MTTKANFNRQLKIHAKAYHNKLKNEIIKEWGKHALSDSEVSEIGKELLGSKFRGVFPQDKVPFTNTSKYMIINVDKSGMPGSHWVAIYQDTKRTFYIYDSFSRTSKKLLKHLYDKAKLKGYKVIDVNLHADQFGKSQICGPISVAWLSTVHKYGIKTARHI
jgi:hypothetical protein